MSEISSQLQNILLLLEENKARDIVSIDVREQTSVTDYMVIATVSSSRQLRAISLNILEKMKSLNFPPLGVHGLDGGDWALLDFGDCVLHVMLPESRAYYNLEGFWQEKEA